MSREAGISLTFDVIDSQGEAAFEFESLVQDRREQGWTGLSVTHPFKVRALEMADRVASGLPKGVGASNLLLFEGNSLRALNTDYSGFLGAWQEGMAGKRPGKVAMAGAGGVARAIGFALLDLGAEEIAIWDREDERAVELAGDIGGPARAVAMSEASSVCKRADGLVNATALGMAMYPGMAFTDSDIGGQSWAFDAVYTPVITEFLRTAADRGLHSLTGFDLFRHMAMATFEAYSGSSIDRLAWREKLEVLRPDDPPR